jgi:hypothetical protein
MSQLLNHTDNVQKYTELYQRLTDKFHRVLYNRTIGAYVDGSQPMNILALALPDVVVSSSIKRRAS